MDDFTEQIKTALQGTIDFNGQQLVSHLAHVVMYGGSILAVMAGLICNNFFITIYGILATAIALFLVILPWPAYRQYPVKWVSPTY